MHFFGGKNHACLRDLPNIMSATQYRMMFNMCQFTSVSSTANISKFKGNLKAQYIWSKWKYFSSATGNSQRRHLHLKWCFLSIYMLKSTIYCSKSIIYISSFQNNGGRVIIGHWSCMRRPLIESRSRGRRIFEIPARSSIRLVQYCTRNILL